MRSIVRASWRWSFSVGLSLALTTPLSVVHAANHYRELIAFNDLKWTGLPTAPVTYSAGKLYGTGTTGYGEIFEVDSPTKAGWLNYTDFGWGFPLGGLLQIGDYLWGTFSATTTAGTTVFKLKPEGLDEQGQYTNVYTFEYGNGNPWSPSGSLITDKSGYLYGVSSYGGTGAACAYGCGTVYRVSLDGHEKTLYSFQSGKDGALAEGGLSEDSSGNFYGTTFAGGGTGCGGAGCGIIFKLAGKREVILYRFTGGADGAGPANGVVIDGFGNLFGTASYGGSANKNCSSGCGTVFEYTNQGLMKTLVIFKGGKDGSDPLGGVTLDGAGNVYGTTLTGGGGVIGTGCPSYSSMPGCGTVFSINMGNGDYQQIHAFTGQEDGANPMAGLTYDGTKEFYGTTYMGGSTEMGYYGGGTIFKFEQIP